MQIDRNIFTLNMGVERRRRRGHCHRRDFLESFQSVHLVLEVATATGVAAAMP